MPNFSAGGIATPADAALMMQLGAEAVFVGSGIFMKDGSTRLEVGRFPDRSFMSPEERREAETRARAIVRATTHFNDHAILAECAAECTGAMKGLAVSALDESSLMQTRGW